MEDDPTKDLPEPKPADTQPNLMQILDEVHQLRELVIAEFQSLRVEMGERFNKLDYGFIAFNKRLTSVETEIAGLDQRVENLENRP